jgi:pimeloyl-ACP methyl ester carboxylesterase
MKRLFQQICSSSCSRPALSGRLVPHGDGAPWLQLLLLLLAAGCAAPRTPVLTALRDAPGKTPVVFLHGITGSQLRERDTGRVVWGHSAGFFHPTDRGATLACPLDGSDDKLEPFAPIMDVRLCGLKIFEAYGSLARLMTQNGYQLGDLRHPKPGDNFFFFVYDWRRSSVSAAQELARQLEKFRRVNVVCQSGGAYVGRWLAKYGAASLDEAEAGKTRPLRGVEVAKLIFIGTANGGGIRILHEMNNGRQYVPYVGRRIEPEVLFTFPSLYDDLPCYRRDWFFDAAGKPLDVDLYDPANWRRYGWAGCSSTNTPAQNRFLAEQLANAQRFHNLLQQDAPGFGPTRYYSLQNLYQQTPERAMLVQEDGKWRTLFLDEKAVYSDRIRLALAASPGDGHATLNSQWWFSPQEKTAFAQPVAYIEGGHFEIVLNPATQLRLLEFLAE